MSNPLAPRVAIISPNTLAVLGLKSILQNVARTVEIDSYNSFDSLCANNQNTYFHYFVSEDIVSTNMEFFRQNSHKTIVLTSSDDSHVFNDAFHYICITQSEKQLLRSLLMLEQHAHPNGKNLPVPKTQSKEEMLSPREIEVMSLIVMGYINKEIADKLNISVTTVITHRKNIMSKLRVRSVSALTIYAVVNGYVSINDI